VIRTRVGYTGGTTADPTYRNIGDHAEALQVDYEPDVVTYDELLGLFWSSHDATRGHFSTQYMSAVYAADDSQLERARATGDIAALERGGELATSVLRLERFYRAEDYHQKYRLRRHQLLVDELRGRFKTDQGMVDSTIAARLNGYLGGYGRREEQLAALEGFGLSAPAANLVRERVA
jgi:peptide-methionine (S)-S-oxide reductase